MTDDSATLYRVEYELRKQQAAKRARRKRNRLCDILERRMTQAKNRTPGTWNMITNALGFKCPHCGEVDLDWAEHGLYEDVTGSGSCYNCGRSFYARIETQRVFVTWDPVTEMVAEVQCQCGCNRAFVQQLHPLAIHPWREFALTCMVCRRWHSRLRLAEADYEMEPQAILQALQTRRDEAMTE